MVEEVINLGYENRDELTVKTATKSLKRLKTTDETPPEESKFNTAANSAFNE